MSKASTQTELAHVPDAAWIYALWIAKYGGDPGLEKVAHQVIAAMAPYAAGPQGIAPQEFEESMSRLGIGFRQEEMEAELTPSGLRPRRQYCFTVRGVTICVSLPPVFWQTHFTEAKG